MNPNPSHSSSIDAFARGVASFYSGLIRAWIVLMMLWSLVMMVTYSPLFSHRVWREVGAVLMRLPDAVQAFWSVLVG